MASSSSTIGNYGHYDVFLSFRGEDTRYNFTNHLYDTLCRNNIKAFIDDKIDRGDQITPALERVIEIAKITIIVFSKNYAESSFCLDELVKIMECKVSKAQLVLPIFYKADPLEVTYQEAFARHETNANWRKRRRGETIEQGRKKVERWKLAFRESLELAGWHIVENSLEVEIIRKITKVVSEKLKNNVPKGEELMCTLTVGQKAEDNFKKIWEYLMDDNISRVGLHGMGGVGKTTIATRINDQLLATVDSFSRVCWVTVSKDLSIFNMQNTIAEMIELGFSKEDDERKRAAKLRKKLKTEKFVLILDDVWEAFEIEDVGIPPLVNGKKLLMTSRSRRVCERMECKPIEVKPLSEMEALDLFIKESKCQINDSLQLGDIVGSIVKECGGLPLAIVVIARTMRGVQENWKWRDTLRELRKPCDAENPEIEEKVFKILKFNYDRLPNDRCRQCFLYCSLFPEDHKFKRWELIYYWIAEGLIDGVDSKLAEIDKGNVILDELVHASLLETCERGWRPITMHDVIKDMTYKIIKFGLQFEHSVESVHALDMLKFFPNSTPHCSKLKTLVLEGKDIKELSSCFFANMQSLSLLHISNMDYVKSLPDCISNLRNLRLLIIKGCKKLKCIPSLGGLVNLRHLKISWNNSLEEIPKGIESLVNLRVLDLSGNCGLWGLFPCSVAEKLSHLQILHLGNNVVAEEAEALISLEKLEILYVNFNNFKKLNCYIKSGHWRRLLEYNIHYGVEPEEIWRTGVYLKTMSLRGIRDAKECKEFVMFLPNDIQFLELKDWQSPMSYYFKNPKFAYLQSLHISTCKSWYLLTVELAQQLLYNVEELYIYFCDELEEIIGGEEEWLNPSNYINHPIILLPNLKTLKLWRLPKLRSIYRGRMMCPSLESILIEECNKVERLPFCMEKEGTTQNSSMVLVRTLRGFPVSRTRSTGTILMTNQCTNIQKNHISQLKL